MVKHFKYLGVIFDRKLNWSMLLKSSCDLQNLVRHMQVGIDFLNEWAKENNLFFNMEN